MSDTEMNGESSQEGQKVLFKCNMEKDKLREFASWLGDFRYKKEGEPGLPGEIPPKPYLLAKVQTAHVTTGEPLATIHRAQIYKQMLGEVPRLDRLFDDGRTDQMRLSSRALLDKLLENNGRQLTVNFKDGNETYLISVESVERRNDAKGTIYNPAFNEYNSEQLERLMKKAGVKKVEAITKRGRTIEERIATGVYILTFNDNQLPKHIFAGYWHLTVREFYDNPMQCNQCLQLNHTKKWCKNKEVCFSCGEPGHVGNDCKQVACVNCLSTDHVSKDRNCPIYQFEKRVNIYSQQANVTKGAARAYAYHAVRIYAGMMGDETKAVTYADQLKSFRNRALVPVQTRPDERDTRPPKLSAVLPRDTNGNDIKSLDNVQTGNYMESLILNQMITGRNRAQFKSRSATTTARKPPYNRPPRSAQVKRNSDRSRSRSIDRSKNTRYDDKVFSDASEEVGAPKVTDFDLL